MHDVLVTLRQHLIVAIAAAAAAVAAVLPGAAAGSTAEEVFARVSGGVVVVMAADAGGAQRAQGSGVVVGANEVATNCHVVAREAEIAVRRAADAQGPESYWMAARLAARNEDRDLCLLSVEELSDPPAAVPVALGGARAAAVGEEVYAIGAPGGLELSITRGIVSQLWSIYGERSAPVIQTDAATSPGSSGGGLFNGQGELIGITTVKLSDDGSEGLSFAVPAEWVADLRAEAAAARAAARDWADCFASPTANCLIAAALELANALDHAWGPCSCAEVHRADASRLGRYRRGAADRGSDRQCRFWRQGLDRHRRCAGQSRGRGERAGNARRSVAKRGRDRPSGDARNEPAQSGRCAGRGGR